MSIIRDITSTVKSIFNADDDMLFDGEEGLNTNKASKPIFAFPKKKNEAEFSQNNSLPSFDVNNHNFNFAHSGDNRNKQSNGKIQVYVPKSFEEAFNIIKDVKSGFTAMVNVEVANPQVSQRIVDLISGAIYALGGECKKMGEKQYIFSIAAETVGAYDYLPVNGVKAQDVSSGFNFDMTRSFDFLNQQNQMNMMGQPQNPMNMMGQQQAQPWMMQQQPYATQNMQPQQQPMQNNQNINANLVNQNPIPPISQF